MSLHRLAAFCALISLSPSCSANPKSKIQNPKWTRSIPLGGIGCGGFEVLPDGRFTRGTFNNNWERPIDPMRGCFAAVWARAGEKSVAQALTSAPEYGLPASAAIEFDGYFPRAVLRFADTRLPVSVTLRAYSSLVPQDLKNSSIPAALFVFTVKNEANGPVQASVALSWENLLGVGGTAGKGVFSDRTGNTTTSLPVTGGIFGLRMASPDKQLIDPPNRLPYNARGSYALLAAPTTPETVVTTASWNALDSSPGWWKAFSTSGAVEGSVGAGSEGKVHPAGVVALKVSLREKESVDLPFAIAWHTPRLYTLGGTEYGHFYEKSFDDAVEAGRYALDNRQAHLALMDEWQNRLLRSSLPGWLTRKVMNDASVLFTNTLLTRDSGLGGTAPGPYRFSLFDIDQEGATLGAADRRYLAHALLLNWFPDLDLREMGDVMERQTPSGAVPAGLGSLLNGFAASDMVAPTAEPAVVAGYVFQVGQRFRWTGDHKFLDRFYPSLKHAMEYAASQDKDADGVPDSTGEAGRRLGRLYWLASCAVAKELAEAMADKGFAGKCTGWIESAERAIGPAYTDEEVMAAAPALWMAERLEVATPTLSTLGLQLQKVVCGVPSLDAPPNGPATTITNSTFGPGDGGRRRAMEAGVLGAAAIATLPLQPGASHADCSLAWLLGIDLWIDHTPPDRRPLATTSSWYALQALEGLKLDIPDGRLTLAPTLPVKVKSLTAPLFTPTFWASLDYRVSLTSARLAFRLDRVMPAQPARKPQKPDPADAETPAAGLLLKEVVLPERPDRVTTEVTASVGRAPVPGQFTRREDGRLVFAFTTPLSLTVGQTLGFHLR